MFKGFEVKLPEYSVVTPQTKHTFNVRSLTVQEEEKMKGSLLTPVKIVDHLNRCLFECIVKKPEKVKSYEDFLKNITIKDRDAILYGLYHITYEEIRNYDVQCSSCGFKHSVTVEASSTFNYNEYPGKDILTKKVKVDLPIFKGVSVYIRQPTLQDELKIQKELTTRSNVSNDLLNEILIIDRFEQDQPDSKDPIVYKSKMDILDAYLSLAPMDKRAIYDKYKKVFGKYGIDLKMKVICPSCANDEIIDIDLVENFFRNVYVS